VMDKAKRAGHEVWTTSYASFRNGSTTNKVPKVNLSADIDAKFIAEATLVLNAIPSNRPIILIGHSYGGDSILKILPLINRDIQLVVTIDPVGTGGFRRIATSRPVPSNVQYFMNRWQENGLAGSNIVPFDSRRSGSILCRARVCDQEAENLARRANGSEERISCERHEITCPGYQPWPGGSNGTKAKRMFHNDMPVNAFIQRIVGDRMQQQLASFRPPSSASSPDTVSPSSISSFSLGFYQEPSRPEVYLVFRSSGRHCHVQNPDQMKAFGGWGKVQQTASASFRNSSGGFSGGCGFPNGFYRLGSKPEVYRLYGSGIAEFNIGDKACHVVNPAQMNALGGFGQVVSVDTGSDLNRGRTFIGGCPNP
jgi:pimeloyl-ACP methyl ester carboxylesterase